MKWVNLGLGLATLAIALKSQWDDRYDRAAYYLLISFVNLLAFANA